MHVSKWGNSLAIRLPAAIVEALNLQSGDDIKIEVAEGPVLRIARDTSRADALARMETRGWVIPADLRFSRDDANARGLADLPEPFEPEPRE